MNEISRIGNQNLNFENYFSVQRLLTKKAKAPNIMSFSAKFKFSTEEMTKDESDLYKQREVSMLNIREKGDEYGNLYDSNWSCVFAGRNGSAAMGYNRMWRRTGPLLY